MLILYENFMAVVTESKRYWEHFKKHHCTQDGNCCQPIYLLFIVREVVLTAVFLVMCCLGIQEMHFLDLILFSVSLRYFCTALLPRADLMTPVRGQLPRTCHPLFTCIKQKGPWGISSAAGSEQLLLKSENLFQQAVHRQCGSSSSKHHPFPLPC